MGFDDTSAKIIDVTLAAFPSEDKADGSRGRHRVSTLVVFLRLTDACCDAIQIVLVTNRAVTAVKDGHRVGARGIGVPHKGDDAALHGLCGDQLIPVLSALVVLGLRTLRSGQGSVDIGIDIG